MTEGQPKYDAYIAGPSFGYPDLNRANFLAVQRHVRERMDLETLIPHDIPPFQHGKKSCPNGYRRSEGSEHSECCYARSDLVYMLRDCLSVYVLPGWEPSVGSRLEVLTAVQCGMPISFISSKQQEIMRDRPMSRNHVIGAPNGLMALKGGSNGFH
jgi:hypothetical protein